MTEFDVKRLWRMGLVGLGCVATTWVSAQTAVENASNAQYEQERAAAQAQLERQEQVLRAVQLPDAPLPEASDWTLARLMGWVRSNSPQVGSARLGVEVAQAGVTAAAAYPNPELSADIGRLTPRAVGVGSGQALVLSATQALDLPYQREPRVQAAQARVGVAQAQVASTLFDVMTSVQQRFYGVLQLQEQLRAYEADLRLTEQIRDRVNVRVQAGESPRFDLIRAEAEVEVARKLVLSAQGRVGEAMLLLRQALGPRAPADLRVRVHEDQLSYLNDEALASLKDQALRVNPDVIRASAEWLAAQEQVRAERALATPAWSIRAQQSTEPDVRTTQVGAVVRVPLWDRRQGPIEQAVKTSEQARLAMTLRQFEIQQAVDANVLRYRNLQGQLKIIEGGLLEKAQRTVAVAEAAYRLGERGILEYLDAQRQFRAVRNELINTRFELQFARVELERLAGKL